MSDSNNAVASESSPSYFSLWWGLRDKNTPLWKVFWLFWFIPSNVVRVLLFVGSISVLKGLHMELHQHLLHCMSLMSIPFLIIDVYALYYVFKARSRCKAVWFGLAALALSGVYIFQDILNILLLLHPHK